MENLIEELAEVLCKSLRMLQEEIEENRENLNTFEDVNNLVEDWNKIVDKYLEKEWLKCMK